MAMFTTEPVKLNRAAKLALYRTHTHTHHKWASPLLLRSASSGDSDPQIKTVHNETSSDQTDLMCPHDKGQATKTHLNAELKDSKMKSACMSESNKINRMSGSHKSGIPRLRQNILSLDKCA